jgi:hypothetical protein
MGCKIKDMELASIGGTTFYANGLETFLSLEGDIVLDSTSGISGIVVLNAAPLFVKGSIVLKGSSGNAFTVVTYSQLYFEESSVVDATLSLSEEFIQCARNSVALASPSASITGNVTGTRYFVYDNSIIQTYGAGANRFPGSIAGIVSSATGGYYQ